MATKHIQKYVEIAKINSVNALHHFTNLFGRGVLLLVRLWIFTQLYRATFATQHTSTINGLTLAMVIWSLSFVQSFETAARPNVSRMIDDDVKSGALAYSINRPYHYNLFHYFGHIGRVVPSLIVNLLMGCVFAFVFVGPIGIEPMSIVAGATLLFFGYSLDFLMSLTIGLSAFWLEDTQAILWIYQKGFLVFGGAILPLALFPDHVRHIAELMPFAELYYAASRILIHYDETLFLHFLTIQLCWIGAFLLITSILFARGVKAVSVNGG